MSRFRSILDKNLAQQQQILIHTVVHGAKPFIVTHPLKQYFHGGTILVSIQQSSQQLDPKKKPGSLHDIAQAIGMYLFEHARVNQRSHVFAVHPRGTGREAP